MTEPKNLSEVDVPPTSGVDVHGTSDHEVGPQPPEKRTGHKGSQEPKERSRSLWADAWRELIRNPMFVISAIIVLLVISMAIAPWLWTTMSPEACTLQRSKAGPTAGHPFGFTIQGCDMYTHVIYGARPSITIAVVVTAATALIGIILGTLAGFYGGWVDTLISRFTDIVFGLPFIVGAILILSMLGGGSVWSVSLILIALGWTQITRIMRGSIIEILNRDYVRAARGLGASNARIIFRHLLPNALAPVVVISTVSLGAYVSAEATLTFLGVGLTPPAISWGILISRGDQWALAGHWHLLVFPCLFLVVTVLAFIMMGDALRDALDPKLR